MQHYNTDHHSHCWFSGKVSYLVCRDLNTDPNPSLLLRVKVDLPNLAVSFFDSAGRAETPRLGFDPALFRTSSL